MKKITLNLWLLLAFIVLLPGQGLADENLRDTTLELEYTPIEIELAECPVKIAVVKFSETTPIKEVGQSKQFRYIPSIDIGSWMGQAVFTQLKSQGFDVEYFENMEDAGDMFIITGIANKVFINRPRTA